MQNHWISLFVIFGKVQECKVQMQTLEDAACGRDATIYVGDLDVMAGRGCSSGSIVLLAS